LEASPFPWPGNKNQKIPARSLLPEHPIQVLLLRANDLSSGAKAIVTHWMSKRLSVSAPQPHRIVIDNGPFPLLISAFAVE
jgi:hypothetical protein